MIENQVLAHGQLPGIDGVLYSCPLYGNVHIENIILTNTNNDTETFNIVYVPGGDTPLHLAPYNATLAAGKQTEIDPQVTLTYGDTIRGFSTNAAMVDYVIIGRVA